MAEDKTNSNFHNLMEPFLDGYRKKLLTEFENRKIIDAEDVKDLVSPGLSQKDDNGATRDNVFDDLFNFSNIVRAVYSNLDYPDSTATPSLKLMEIISRLDNVKAISALWKNNEDVIDIMNKMNSLNTNDPIKLQRFQKILDDNKINLNILIPQLLEFYGTHKACSYFEVFNYRTVDKNRILLNKFDLMMEPQNEAYHPILLFDFKYLRNAILPTRNSLLKSLEAFSLYNANENQSYYYFMVVFTDKESAEFDKIKFEFKQTIKEIPEYAKYVDRIRFLPVPIGSLQMINEGFKEFKDSFIEEDINNYIFRSHTPPKNRPDRNDHFYDRIFKLRETDFKIVIRPANTPFWRFGFRYSVDEEFPAITEDRHGDGRTDVIHLTVGDIVNNKWQGENHLLLSWYRHEKLTNIWSLQDGYKGEPITLMVETNSTASVVSFKFLKDDKVVKQIPFDLSKYNFCQLAVWSDYNNNFTLPTDIKIIYKGYGKMFLHN